jgi:hypothetical protein
MEVCLMAKLVIKQELSPEVKKHKWVLRIQWLMLLTLILIVILAFAAWFSAKPAKVVTASTAKSQLLMSLPNEPSYQVAAGKLNKLMQQFEQAEAKGAESYEKNTQLFQQAETILTQLAALDSIIADMHLNDEQAQKLTEQQAYQQDYWEAKLQFHRLRMERLKASQTKLQGTQVLSAQAKLSPSADASGFPPELPSGVCPLTGPDAAKCKP